MSTRSSKPRTRAVRRKTEDAKQLSITSLLDVLTIILVFLIKNVSMEAVKISEVEHLRYPTTITTEKLMENATVTPIKIFPDKVLLGNSDQLLGTPADLTSSADIRKALVQFLKLEIATVDEDKLDDACLIVQCDANIPCAYITEVVSAAVGVGYPNIYFATLEEEDWLRSYASAFTN